MAVPRAFACTGCDGRAFLIDAGEHYARCGRCQRLVDVGPVLGVAPRPPAIPSARMEVVESTGLLTTGDPYRGPTRRVASLAVSWPVRRKHDTRLLPASVVIALLFTVLVAPSIGSIQVIILSAVMTLILALSTAASLLNRVTLTLENQLLESHEGPVTRRRPRRLRAGEIRGLFCNATESGDGGWQYDVYAQLHRGRSELLGSLETVDEARYLMETLERALDQFGDGVDKATNSDH